MFLTAILKYLWKFESYNYTLVKFLPRQNDIVWAPKHQAKHWLWSRPSSWWLNNHNGLSLLLLRLVNAMTSFCLALNIPQTADNLEQERGKVGHLGSCSASLCLKGIKFYKFYHRYGINLLIFFSWYRHLFMITYLTSSSLS